MSDKMTFKTPPAPSPTAEVRIAAFAGKSITYLWSNVCTTPTLYIDTGSRQLDNSSSGFEDFHCGPTFDNVLSLVQAGKIDTVMHVGKCN